MRADIQAWIVSCKVSGTTLCLSFTSSCVRSTSPTASPEVARALAPALHFETRSIDPWAQNVAHTVAQSHAWGGDATQRGWNCHTRFCSCRVSLPLIEVWPGKRSALGNRSSQQQRLLRHRMGSVCLLGRNCAYLHHVAL